MHPQLDVTLLSIGQDLIWISLSKHHPQLGPRPAAAQGLHPDPPSQQHQEHELPAQRETAPSPQAHDCSFTGLKIEMSVTLCRANARLTSVRLSCVENAKPGQGLPQLRGANCSSVLLRPV